MRIFYICRRVPFPPDRGDKIAAFNQIRRLAGRHEMHVFCLGDGVRDLANISGLQAYAKSVTAVPVDEFTIKLRALNALLTGRPLSVAALNETRLHEAIHTKFAELRPDLIIVYSLQHGAVCPALPRCAAENAFRRSRLAQMAAIRGTVEGAIELDLRDRGTAASWL
jgi:hypothetical protein